MQNHLPRQTLGGSIRLSDSRVPQILMADRLMFPTKTDHLCQFGFFGNLWVLLGKPVSTVYNFHLHVCEKYIPC